jgi:hypothetical protein
MTDETRTIVTADDLTVTEERPEHRPVVLRWFLHAPSGLMKGYEYPIPYAGDVEALRAWQERDAARCITRALARDVRVWDTQDAMDAYFASRA